MGYIRKALEQGFLDIYTCTSPEVHQKEGTLDNVFCTILRVAATNWQDLVPAPIQNPTHRCVVCGQSESSRGRCHHETPKKKAALNTRRVVGIKTRFEKFLQDVLQGRGGGGVSRGEYFVVGNFVFQMCAKIPAQFSGHFAK